MRRLLFAANWKMHVGPAEARAFVQRFTANYAPQADREIWLFPPAVSLEATAQAVVGRDDLRAGAQNIHWEPKGAFTGETSGPLAAAAGAAAVLVGHSERRHVFGETDEQTARKVAAARAARLVPVLCVGETLDERAAGRTMEVVECQLQSALGILDGPSLESLVIAYEPVWAIGTGRNATPRDAAEVHREIRTWLTARGARTARVLYGGSVSGKNVTELMAERELDGVLVGGASLDPDAWSALVRAVAS